MFKYITYLITLFNTFEVNLNTRILNTVFKYIYWIYTLCLNTFLKMYLITLFNTFEVNLNTRILNTVFINTFTEFIHCV